MPRGDRTGPRGMGPMTGRRAGFCTGSGTPGYANPIPNPGFGLGMGRGCGMGRGFGGGGRGWRNMFYTTGLPGWMHYNNDPTPPPADKAAVKQNLKKQADYLQNQLNSIQKHLEEIDKKEESQ